VTEGLVVVDELTRLELREELHRRHIRPERWKLKVSERFIRAFLPHPTHVHDESTCGPRAENCPYELRKGELFADSPDWRPLGARQGSFGTLWRRDNLSPPIHVRNQPPVTSAVVKAVRYTVVTEDEAGTSTLRRLHDMNDGILGGGGAGSSTLRSSISNRRTSSSSSMSRETSVSRRRDSPRAPPSSAVSNASFAPFYAKTDASFY
jgi:hypothetical protein